MANLNPSQLTAWTGAIDIANDLVMVWKNSNSTLYKATPNQLANLTSAYVGINDTQTLTNKTLTAPAVSAPVLSGTITGTYTLGGIPTFPAAVVTLTGSQTLTNKTLTSPTINAPTITNATISADALTGFSASTNGTLYGISVAGSIITSVGSIGANANVTNGVKAANLDTAAIYLGSVSKVDANFATTNVGATQVTGLTSTVTIPSGGRKVKITVSCSMGISGAGQAQLSIWDGTVGSGVNLHNVFFLSTGTQTIPTSMTVVVSPVAGSKTYNIGLQTSAGTATVYTQPTYPALLLVEAI